MFYIFIALIGASIGSFINVVSVRLNNGENFIFIKISLSKLWTYSSHFWI